MTVSKLPDQAPAYLDFSKFEKLKRQSREEDKSAAIQSTAKQLESVFLNMMLKSMRAANSGFSEGNYLSSRDGEFYQDMYDHQLAMNISNGKGIGLAEMIVKQMTRLEKPKLDDATAESPAVDVATHDNGFALPTTRRTALESVPVSQQSARSLREAELLREIERMQFAADAGAPESTLFAPLLEQQTIAPVVESAPETELYLNSPELPESWSTPEEFVNCILPHAERAARELNVDPQAIVAQAILETGWGQRQIKDAQGNNSYNLFGIKAGGSWEGEVSRKRTLEYRNGIAASETASFRSYGSLSEAFDDYVKFLKDGRRYDGVFEQKKDAKQWGFALQKAGYATDPKYGNKIASILESDILQSTFNTGYKSF